MKSLFSIMVFITAWTLTKAAEVKFNVVVPISTNECFIAGNFNNWNLTDIHQCTKIDSVTFTVKLDDTQWVDTVNTSTLKYVYLNCSCDWSCVERGSLGQYTSERKYRKGMNDTVLTWTPTTNYSLLEMRVKTPPNTQKCFLVGMINTITGIPNGYYELEKNGLGTHDSVVFNTLISPDCKYEYPIMFSCGRSLDSINTENSNEGNLNYSVKAWKCDPLDFVFDLYFKDSKGNKDTLTIGYDTNATDSLNKDEVNIINRPLDSLFDVRISNAWQNINMGLTDKYYQTKKHIVKNNCGGWYQPVTMDIYCNNWPITIEWDSTKFSNNCNIGSIMTSFHPGGWFDVGGGFIAELSRTSSLKLYKYPDNRHFEKTEYFYLNETNDTIYVFWQAFGDAKLPRLGVEQTKINHKIYPNPASDHITIKNDFGNSLDIQITDITGSTIKQLSTNNETTITLDGIPSGMYVVRINNENHKLILKQPFKTLKSH